MMKKLKKLSLCGIIGLASVLHLNAQVDLANGLVAKYPFSGTITGVVSDVSGKGNNGVIVGSVTSVADRNGTANSAYSFDGINGNITINTFTGFSTLTGISISYWFYVPTVSGNSNTIYPQIAEFYNIPVDNGATSCSFTAGNYVRPSISYVPAEIYSIVNNQTASQQNCFTARNYGVNTWYHVVSTFNNSSKVITNYINGVPIVTSTAGAALRSINALIIATAHGASPTLNYFAGIIDDISIYNRDINQCEVNLLYNGSPAQPVLISTPGTSLCKNNTNTFVITSVAGVTYKWTAGSGTPTSQSGASATFTWANSGIDFITVTGYNSCSIAGTSLVYPVTITNNVAPSLTAITGLNPNYTSVCISTTGIYTTTLLSGVTYDWALVSGTTSTPGIGNSNFGAIQFLNAGVNTIKVRASNGCGYGNYITLPVTVNSGLTNFNISGPNPVCPSSTYAYSVTGVTPSGSYSFTWSAYGNPVYQLNLNSGVTVNQITFPSGSTGTVNITVTGIGTCGYLSVIYPITVNSGPVTPVLTCIAGGIACTTLGVTNYPGGGITWTYGTTTLTGVTSITRTPDTQVTVIYTNSVTGCTSRNYYFPTPVSPCGRLDESEVYIAVDAPTEKFKLYPNPNEGNLTFETDGTKGEAFVIDMLGQIVTTIRLNENQFAYSLEIPAKSTYVLRIRTEKANKNIKFVVR